MDIGIGLPATIPGVTRSDLLEWARRAEARGFSCLGTLDRLAYPNLEPLVALGAAAAVTEKIRLVTAILIGPWRGNNALLAKQIATLDVIAPDRLEVGIALGARPDDYEVSGVKFEDRGRLFDEQLAEIRELWDGKQIGFHSGVGPKPATEGGPPLLFGAQAPKAYRRAAEHGVGWIAGGGGPDMYRDGAETARAAWKDAGRTDPPQLKALAYWALGNEARQIADWYLHDYYGFLGEIADMIAAGAMTDVEQVQAGVQAYEDHGCEELILFPAAADPAQVDLLADAVL